MAKFKKGDYVEVMDKGCTYSTYNEMAKHLNLSKWRSEETPENGYVYKVVDSAEHLGDSGKIVVAIEKLFAVQAQQYLINEEGLDITQGLPVGECSTDEEEYDG